VPSARATKSRAGWSALRKAAHGADNLMPYIFDAVKSYATLGEICDAMREVFGTYEEIAITSLHLCPLWHFSVNSVLNSAPHDRQ